MALVVFYLQKRFKNQTKSGLTHGALAAEGAAEALHRAPRLQLGLLQGVGVRLGGLGGAGGRVRTGLEVGNRWGVESRRTDTRREGGEEGRGENLKIKIHPYGYTFIKPDFYDKGSTSPSSLQFDKPPPGATVACVNDPHQRVHRATWTFTPVRFAFPYEQRLHDSLCSIWVRAFGGPPQRTAAVSL